MCGTTPTLTYAPSRLVALAVPGGRGGDSAPAEGGGSPAGGAAGGGSSGDGPQRPLGGPSPSAFSRNLKVPMPLGRKVRLVVRNTAIKFKTRQNCCGHPGEPGC